MSLPFPSGQKVFNTDLNPILLGWIAFSWAGSTLAYVSADAPTFVFSINADVTAVIEPGMRIRLTQTTDKFFIVTAVGAFAAGVTPITVYGGTDYTLANAAISAGALSMVKKPFGFNADPLKWRQELRDTANRSQSSPSSTTIYNPGALSLSVPIGAWVVTYEATLDLTSTGTGSVRAIVTLSTANNSESDTDLTSSWVLPVNNASYEATAYRQKNLLLAAKTSYFLNVETFSAGTSSIGLRGDLAPTIIRAVCAYL